MKNIQTVTVIGVTGTMGANVAGILLRLEMRRFIVSDVTLKKLKRRFPAL